MSNTLSRRLARATHAARVQGRRIEVWRQDPGGLNRFTSPQHPGVVVTREALTARPYTGQRIVVTREALPERSEGGGGG